jgi:hypothetical protein
MREEKPVSTLNPKPIYYTGIFFNKCPAVRAPHIRVHALVDDTHL